MKPDLEQFIRDVTAVTGATPPVLVQPHTPTLLPSLIDSDASAPFYIVGVIGGKDVGKSALVNALVGQTITPSTSFGAGTETAIAYAHESVAAPLRELLSRETPGHFAIITHDLPSLRRQVLLDLPDIDSVYSAHLELTRRLLRHMLFPLFVQSIEKYADSRFQDLLRRIAAGNSPQNFLFALNKIDQLQDPSSISELTTDYADRLQTALSLPSPPRIFSISATHPADHDLPALKTVLSTPRTDTDLSQSRSLASRRQSDSVLAWTDALDLPARAARLSRVEEDADELIRDRMTLPLVDRAVPALIDDPAHRLSILDSCQWRRASRWPVVNLIHVLLAPLLLIVRRNITPSPTRNSATADAVALTHDPEKLASMIQSTFAYLHQAHPILSSLYHHRRLWDDAPAHVAAQQLQRRIADTLHHQRSTILARVANRKGLFFALPRLTLTLGALLWFPFVQPLLEAILTPKHGSLNLALLAVKVLGVTSLLQNAAFLILYFLALWLLLRWDTLRLVDRRLTKWRTSSNLDPSLNPAAAILEWTADLTAPLRVARQSIESLVTRADSIRA